MARMTLMRRMVVVVGERGRRRWKRRRTREMEG